MNVQSRLVTPAFGNAITFAGGLPRPRIPAHGSERTGSAAEESRKPITNRRELVLRWIKMSLCLIRDGAKEIRLEKKKARTAARTRN